MPTEPKTLTHHDNPAREFRAVHESGIAAVIVIEYRGGGWWRAYFDEGAAPDSPDYTSRSLADTQKWAASTMEEHADTARATCECGTDGADTTSNGTFACGVLNPHGISVSVLSGDGDDLTQDYYINGM